MLWIETYEDNSVLHDYYWTINDSDAKNAKMIEVGAFEGRDRLRRIGVGWISTDQKIESMER